MSRRDVRNAADGSPWEEEPGLAALAAELQSNTRAKPPTPSPALQALFSQGEPALARPRLVTQHRSRRRVAVAAAVIGTTAGKVLIGGVAAAAVTAGALQASGTIDIPLPDLAQPSDHSETPPLEMLLPVADEGGLSSPPDLTPDTHPDSPPGLVITPADETDPPAADPATPDDPGAGPPDDPPGLVTPDTHPTTSSTVPPGRPEDRPTPSSTVPPGRPEGRPTPSSTAPPNASDAGNGGGPPLPPTPPSSAPAGASTGGDPSNENPPDNQQRPPK